MAEISSDIKQAYEDQYNDSIVTWRSINGRFKAENIVEILDKNGLKPLRICEVGCGEGSILKWLSDLNVGKELFGLDISESAIEIAKGKQIANLKEIGLFDGYEIPYPDGAFDLVVCSHVIEHVEHPRLLLRELKRISTYQYMEVPIDFSLTVDKKLEHYLGYGHINIYTPNLFRFLVRSEKFDLIDDTHIFLRDETLKMIYKDNRTGFYLKKYKNKLFNAFKLFRDLKPDAYGILTKSGSGDLAIFSKSK